ncbi:rod-determining factor RdfA [Salinirubrum litoreum]|uniref:Rod-determining factor RdfA n=1 Tax=Salinirubrum litoreum TaxID=1126234 RepID=A0ABD5RGY2_9EURY|nr:rod-determining factor RdfA [Salinirubrum litoreum]
MSSDDSDGDRPPSKVVRVIEAYGLTGLGEDLETRWLDTGEEGLSTRQLADYFNKHVLERAVGDSDLSLLDTEVDRLYEQLTSDDVSAGLRTRTERRLAQNGVDVDRVRDDFVSHQSIHTYLRRHREVEQPTKTAEERRENALERVQKLQDRTAAVTGDAIESLQREELVPAGEIDVIVDIQVVYQDSADQYDVYDLLREE